ncbi:unnamed protein product [Alopecurus aequalis]
MGGFRYTVRENILSISVLVGAVVVVTTVAILLAAYGVLRHASITVVDASLTKFSLATASATTLAYDLSLALEVRNPNWAMAMTNTEPLEAAYSFHGQQFEPGVQVSDKGTRYAARTTVHHVVTSSGGTYVALGNAGVADYEKQKADGTFEVEVKLTGKVRYTARYTKCKSEATCKLKLQVLEPSGTPAPGVVVFEKVECELAKSEKNC